MYGKVLVLVLIPTVFPYGRVFHPTPDDGPGSRLDLTL